MDVQTKLIALDTFYFEENTVFHVNNHLKAKGIYISKPQILDIVNELQNERLIKQYNGVSGETINLHDIDDNLVEDYWFSITEDGIAMLMKNNVEKEKPHRIID